jgi:dTDP-4-dehydrorhamnose reductase
MNVLILGHKGMLGHVVLKYFNSIGINTHIVEDRFPSKAFCEKIINSNCEFLINCIGSIPQKTTLEKDMMIANFFLPVFLSENFGGKIIHATTDCEFSGNTKSLYLKKSHKDAIDHYGKSKILGSDYLQNKNNAYIIRTSIIGFEINSSKSLLEWFLHSNSDSIQGFSDHWWNGITTLQWAKIAEKIINGQINENFIQVGSEIITKFDLLNFFNEIFEKKHKIIEKNTGTSIFKCLHSDFDIPSIKDQIVELKNWYK